MTDKSLKSVVTQAWKLAEDPDKIKEYYRTWSASYDDDLGTDTYHGPAVTMGLLDQQVKRLWPQADRSKLRVLDAGCGTGLGGERLLELGYRNIVGFDLSDEMIAQAERKNVYTQLISGVDLTKPLTPQIKLDQFDLVVCVGVLTLGHVPPSGVQQLLEVLRSGGIVALNARELYVQDTDFDRYCEQLEIDGHAKILYKEYGPLLVDTQALNVILQKP